MLDLPHAWPRQKPGSNDGLCGGSHPLGQPSARGTPGTGSSGGESCVVEAAGEEPRAEMAGQQDPHLTMNTEQTQRSLWLGDLAPWQDEAFLFNLFVGTGQLVSVK